MSAAKSFPVIGFIGLGIMGKPMALNLLRANYALVIGERRPAVTEELVAQGARSASTPRDVAAQSEVVITMLPDSPDVEAVVLGESGVRAGVREGTTFIDMSTIAPATSRRIARELGAAKTAALDAPVSGGEQGAIDGTLSIMVGGPEAAFEAMLPIFEAMGKNIIRRTRRRSRPQCLAYALDARSSRPIAPVSRRLDGRGGACERGIRLTVHVTRVAHEQHR